MPNDWLAIPHFQQSADGRCLEACVCMILAYWQNPILESQISELFSSTEIGTPSSRVLRLSQWGYEVIYRSSTIEELQAWLLQDIPVIAFVHTQFLDYWQKDSPHAVVIAGIDDNQIYLHDPAFQAPPQACSLEGFWAGWIEMDEVVAVITPGTG